MDWKCFKCGNIVRSKCVWDRTTYSRKVKDNSVLLFENCVNMPNPTTITIDLSNMAGDHTIESFFISMAETLKENGGLLEKLVCDHEYGLLADTKCVLEHDDHKLWVK